MTSIILTGATGFLGKVILSKILDETEFKLILPVQEQTNCDEIPLSSRIKIVNVSQITEHCDNPAIHIVGAIHAATEYGRSGNDIQKVLSANISLPVTILNILQRKKSNFFINADSFFNKSSNSYPFLIDYSTSKRALHLWLDQLRSLTVINLFLEHIYGPGDSKDKFIPTLLKELSSFSKEEIALSLGDQIRDFIYIDDAANAFIAAINFGLTADQDTYNFEVGTGVGTSIKEFATRLKSLTGSERVLAFGKLPYRENEIKSSIADVKSNKLLLWSAKIDLDQGLVSLIDG
jgi:nucleoside-diphosphate-sugar epimerase